ncbi:hypothetical protein PHYPSEUDO_012553 [Phytophthora pseudosyringae]|uniref:Uncharacterized protein n=1 Tax=Phytophthora pseudosyringae TaxID=221518 RepID=A0A8T1V9I0_9STRA|nr:hypothetical protein PHYPSEUDO_012553 [Phytophthora pseudosyringae]
MAISRSRKRTRLAMVVVRSPTGQGAGEALLEDRRRVQMERQAGDSRQLVVMASLEELRAAQAAARQTAAAVSPRTRTSLAAETQRRLLVYAHRARRFLSHRSVADHLSGDRRREMRSEVRRLRQEIQSLQEQIEVTARSVESMERLAFHLERLTREFLLQRPSDGVRVVRDRPVLPLVGGSAALAVGIEDEDENV